jgi:hypothetical protein
MNYIAFKGFVKSVDLWCELCNRHSPEAEDLFLDSIDNLNKFKGLEVLRGQLLESNVPDFKKAIGEALDLLEKLLELLESNYYNGGLEIQIAYSTLKSDISGAISEVSQFLQNIDQR